VLAADRSYMLDLPTTKRALRRFALSQMNFRRLSDGEPGIARRTHYCGDPQPVEAARSRIGEQLQARAAADLGLVTFTPDDLDWDEEVRIAIEERASLSPDALTGMEANLRFSGKETMETRIFGRLSAWQNWIFSRPKRGRRARCPQGIRQRREGQIQLGPGLEPESEHS